MNWLDRLERNYAAWAIPGLIRHISVLMVVVYGLDHLKIVSLYQWALCANLVKEGEIWRVVTFLFIPADRNPFLLLIQLMFMVMTADGLEGHWGVFRLNVYYLIGAVGTVMISFLMPEAVLDNHMVNLSLFLAFAAVYPEFELLLFFILPVKVKWLAWVSWGFIVWAIVFGTWKMKAAAVLGVINFLLFFGPTLLADARRAMSNHARRRQFDLAGAGGAAGGGARNVCTVCGRTEITDPTLGFRYCTCSRCGPNGVAFCLPHLDEHKRSAGGSGRSEPS